MVKLARAFKVSIDYLVGEGQHATYDKEMVKPLDQIEELPEEENQRINHFMDLIIRDHTAKRLILPNNKKRSPWTLEPVFVLYAWARRGS